MTRPAIPVDEFVPDPTAVPALWGFAIKTAGTIITDQVMSLDEPEIMGVRPVPWMADSGGVRWAQVVDPFGRTLAVARAVPLS